MVQKVTKKGSVRHKHRQKTDDYERLTHLNALVSMLGGETGPEEVAHLNVALRFLRENAPEPEMPPGSFAHCVTQVVRFHDPAENLFHHVLWDARDAETSPLWIRAEALEHLNPLRSHPNALLIVSGLRNACLPPRRRSTPRRQGAYREAMSIIESLAAQQAEPDQSLSVLFI